MLNLSGRLPLISCLLVTAGGRWDFFVQSYRCYLDQTYSNRELVIVNEGPTTYQDRIASHVAGRPDVKLVFLDGKYTLGGLRNISIALSNGDIFVQWDDDDFNTPERLAVQFSHLDRHPEAAACYLSDQLHYYFPTKELYWENWSVYHSGGHQKYSLIPGTLMARKDGFVARYPSGGQWAKAGEDSILAGWLCREEKSVLLLSGKGHMQMYTYHGGNVWDIEHHAKISKERAMPVSHMLQHREQIDATIGYLGLDGPVRVMGREGLAYIHGGQA